MENNMNPAQAEAKRLIDGSKKILIVPHANVDPDGLGAALACYHLLTSIGKECTVLCPDTKPESLSFLPGFEKLEEEIKPQQDFIVTLDTSDGVEIDKLRYAIEDNAVNIIITPKKGTIAQKNVSFAEGPPPFDLLLIVDTAEMSLLGSLYADHTDLFESVPILNIDHHISNTKFGSKQLIDSSASSATEVLYEWFISDPVWETKITPDIATLLLTGLITDTRSFQNPNTTPRSLEVAAELLDRGARQQEIIKFVYKTKPLSTLKIWGRALSHIQVNQKDRIVWSSISKEDLQEMGASSKETHGILDELLTTVPDADVYVLFTEIEEGGFKASMRSSDAADVSAIAGALFGGGGHARAAGFRMSEYDNFQLIVVECIQKIIAQMQGRISPPSQEKVVQPREQIEERKSGDIPGEIDVVKKLSE